MTVLKTRAFTLLKQALELQLAFKMFQDVWRKGVQLQVKGSPSHKTKKVENKLRGKFWGKIVRIIST
jgi:hypothetical protein